MASDTHVEEELDMVTRYIRTKAANWASHGGTGTVVAGELTDLAEEIERGEHWEVGE